ncbi:MAG: hypothetical protein IT457_17710 [Planctomycetes bacterium]|nr:hypothetical protein [Planctomycetota bacterium]
MTAVLIAIVVALGLAALLGGETEPVQPVAVATDEPMTPTDATAEDPLRDADARGVARVQELPVASATARDEVPPEFDSAIERLVVLALEMVDLDARAEKEAVRTRNDEAVALITALLNAVPDCGERAVMRLAELPDTNTTQEIGLRREVLISVLSRDLSERSTRADKGLPRGPVDALVGSMLGIVDLNELTAKRLGNDLLVDAPLLGPPHEEAVLALVESSQFETWLVPTASELLRTLWRNLERSGARHRSDITSLALLYFEDRNEARRLAAVRELVRDPRLRRIALDRVRAQQDAALAAAIANGAASELDSESALELIRELHEIGGTRLLGACTMVAMRDPTAARASYETALGEDRDPGYRAQLLLAATLTPDAASLELARAALRNDLDPEVRSRAMLALTNHPDASIGERAIFEALDDPRNANQPDLVLAAVAGLENLLRFGDRNAIQRIGSRLAIHPLLAEADRAKVRSLLASHSGR